MLQVGRESEVRSYCRSFEAVFERAIGSELFDSDGRRYIDFLAGCSALNYGHNDPDMASALIDYVGEQGLAHGLDLLTPAKESFIEAFVGLVLEPRSLDHRLQFPGPTGTNAVEAALKLARKVTNRTGIIAFTNGFHGVTLGSLAATGNRHHRMGPTVPLSGVDRALYDGYLGPDVDTCEVLARLLDDRSSGVDLPAAFLVETVQGEGGLNVASFDWLRRLGDLARRHGSLLIIDDIQAGCGRTGNFFSFDGSGLVPDIVTLSKSLSGFGLPLSMVLLRPELDRWLPAEHNGTFRGNNLAFVTGRVALEKFWSDDDLQVTVDRRTAMIAARLQRLASEFDAQVKGRGMMLGIDVGSGERAARITGRCFADGLVIETSGPDDEVVKLLPPLTTPDELLDEGLTVIERAFETEPGGLRQAS